MKHLIHILLAVLLLSACCPPETGQGNPPPQTEKVPVFESSFEAVANMGVGWNLGNTLDSWWVDDTDGRDWKRWETGWGQPVTRPELMTMMKNKSRLNSLLFLYDFILSLPVLGSREAINLQ